MGSNGTDTTIILHSPEELLREVPALLGFVPQESLVAILLDRSTLRCTLRWDLEEELTEQAIRIIGIAHRAEADGAVLAVYTDTAETSMHRKSELDRVADLLEEQGIAVHDLLWVSEDRWGSYVCAQSTCCPPEGRPLPVMTPHLEVIRVADGRPAIAPSRGVVRAALEPQPDTEDSAHYLSAQQGLVGLTRSETASLAARVLSRLCELDPTSAGVERQVAVSQALLTLAVQDVPVRDYVLACLATGDTDTAAAAEALAQAALHAPERLRGSVATAAMAALAMDGQNSVSLWAMQDFADGQSLAVLVAAAVEAGFPPQELRDLFAGTLPDVRSQLEDLDTLR